MKQIINLRNNLLTLAMIIFAITGLSSATITGQILNHNDQTISQANVFLKNISDPLLNSSIVLYSLDILMIYPDIIQAVTDENGVFNFQNVPSGSYIIFTTNEVYYQTPHMVDGEIFVITVDADDTEVSDINIKMINTSEFGTVSGFVYNTAGQPIADVSVALVYENNTHILHDYAVLSNEYGFYEIKNIIHGNYKIVIFDYLNNNYEPISYSDALIIDENHLNYTNISFYNLIYFSYGTGSVSGTIYDLNNQPLAFQTLKLQDVNNPHSPGIFFGESSPSGEYHSFEMIPNGIYRVAIISTSTNTPIAYSSIFEISDENQVATGIDITLDYETVSVSGYVSCQDGTSPFPFISLISDLNNHVAGKTLISENGFFRFYNIEEGEYYLIATYNNTQVFFPGVVDYVNAQTIYVGNQNVENITFSIPSFNFYTISGIVTCSITNQPIQNTPVRAKSPYSEYPNKSTLTDVNGYYSMILPQNEYIVISGYSQPNYLIQFYNQVIDPLSSVIINLDSNTSDINFNLSPMPTNNNHFVSGRVTIEGEFPDTGIMVIAVSSDEDWDITTTTNIYGDYTLPISNPGNYYIYAIESSIPPTYYPNVHYWEIADLVSVNGHIHGINMNLENVLNNGINGQNTISGTVTTADENDIISDVSIIVKNSNEQIIGFTKTNEYGQYVINNLPDDEMEIIVTKFRYYSILDNIYLSRNNIIDYTLTPYLTNNNDESIPNILPLKLSNYPNPFNPNTTISFSLQEKEQVTLDIYNIKGQKVRTLIKNETLSGNQNIVWNGKDNNGNELSSGIYFSRIKTKSSSAVGKMILIK